MSENNDELFLAAENAKKEFYRFIQGQPDLFDLLFTAAAAGGHILIEGVPGIAKTLAAKTFAALMGIKFSRIQFTPDLLPSDLTGNMVYRQQTGDFITRFGPLFAEVVLADEVNRAPAKVQSALLEAMEEKQVTIGNGSYKLPDPFIVIATQNPIEHEGTYELPEAQSDRFMLKIAMDYPDPETELKIVELHESGAVNDKVEQCLSCGTFAKIKERAAKITVSDKIKSYIVDITGATRKQSEIIRGASPRASIAFLKCSKIKAFLAGRDYVLPEDIKELAFPVLRHRIKLSYSAEAEGGTEDKIISGFLKNIKTP